MRPTIRMVLLAEPPAPPGNVGAVVAHAQERNAWALRYAPALRRYFGKRVGAAEAEDLVQDVFLAMQVRGNIGEPDNADGYLFRVAARILAKRYSRPRWNWADYAPLDDIFDPSDEISPERTLLARERVSRLMTALEALPPRMAEAFVLHRFDEMTYAEIARCMGVRMKTVESFIARASTRIAAMMGAE